MAKFEAIRLGESITGFLIDGVANTPYVVGTLSFDEQAGVRLEIPYLDFPGEAQFESAQKWFADQTPPENLIFEAFDGTVSLFGCRYSGHSSKLGRGISLGRIIPQEIVAKKRDGSLQNPLTVRTLRSRLDGLNEWTQLSSVQTGRVVDENSLIKKVTIEVASTEKICWSQNDAQMTLASHWSTRPDGRTLTIDESWVVESEFSDSRAPIEHLQEHQKVKALASLVFGCDISFRGHQVKDELFVDRALSGEAMHTPYSQFLTRHTIREHAREELNKKDLANPLASLEEIGSSGLEAWARTFKAWERFIYPAVSSVNHKIIGLENSLVNAAMAMEAAGSILGQVDEENGTYSQSGRPTTATYAFRCLIKSGFPYAGIASSTTGLAKALANVYNTIKHYDRGDFPDPSCTYLCRNIAVLVARFLTLSLVDVSISQGYASSRRHEELRRIKGQFEAHELLIDDTGRFVQSQ